jgi:hypothetical protein
MRGEKKQLLPSEDAAVCVNNRKQTRELAKIVWYKVCKEQAFRCLTSHEGWTDKTIDKVDWDRLYMAL